VNADEVMTWGGEFWGGVNSVEYLDDGEDMIPNYITGLQGDGPDEMDDDEDGLIAHGPMVAHAQGSMQFDNGLYIIASTGAEDDDEEPDEDETEGDDGTLI